MKRLLLAVLAALLLAGCEVADIPSSELFPGSVGDFLRVSGPTPDTTAGVEQAVYQGPAGSATLKVRWVGEENVSHALSELPPTATDIGYDAALGPREGVFFTFADEYHAAWGNGDWVFVLSAESTDGRTSFLAFYGF